MLNPNMNMKSYHEKKNLRYPPLIFSAPKDHLLLTSVSINYTSWILKYLRTVLNKMQRKHDFFNRKLSVGMNTFSSKGKLILNISF